MIKPYESINSLPKKTEQLESAYESFIDEKYLTSFHKQIKAK